MTSLIIASNLKISAVFPETHRELPLIDYALFLHHIIYRLKSVQVLARSLRAQTQDSICLLAIKVLSLRVHAAKSVFKHVNSVLEILSKIQRVLGHVTLISAAFGVALIEPTPVIFSTSAIDFSAIVKREILRLFASIEVIDMLATLAFDAEFFARDGRDRRTSIND